MRINILATLLSVALALPIDQLSVDNSDVRLVELAPGERYYMTPEQLLRAKQDGVNYIDVTDHVDDIKSGSFTTSSENSPAQIPTSVQQRDLFEELSPSLSKEELELKLTTFSAFYTRYAKSETGLESSLWVYDKACEYAGGRDDVEVTKFDHEWDQKSVIVSIKGTENPDKVVIVGAHQDSINLLLPGTLPAPGADDDGSGTVTTLEVLRVLLESGFKPANTLEFHYYSAEELGLLGSQDVFAEYAERHVDVRTMLQQDMTGYSAGSKEANDGQDELGVITDFVDEDLTNFIKLLITEYCSIPYVETQCGYACSDHSSASKYGYQSAFVIESSFDNIDRKIHTTEDKVEYLDFDHMLEHAKLTLGYALELSTLEDL